MILICDTMLGKLSKYLRILGLDTVYLRSPLDLNAYKTKEKPPIFFTKRSLQNISYNNCVYIRSEKAIDQLKEIIKVIGPYIHPETFMSRCINCNALLIAANKDDIETLVPEYVLHRYNTFRACPSCNKIYWGGSHVEHINKWLKEIAAFT